MEVSNEETPEKPVSSYTTYCRCCNKHILKYDCVDLFGGDGELVETLKRIGGIEVNEEDAFKGRPANICRKCRRRLTIIQKYTDEFRAMCLVSNRQQESTNGVKRGRESCTPPNYEPKGKMLHRDDVMIM